MSASLANSRAWTLSRLAFSEPRVGQPIPSPCSSFGFGMTWKCTCGTTCTHTTGSTTACVSIYSCHTWCASLPLFYPCHEIQKGSIESCTATYLEDIVVLSSQG